MRAGRRRISLAGGKKLFARAGRMQRREWRDRRPGGPSSGQVTDRQEVRVPAGRQLNRLDRPELQASGRSLRVHVCQRHVRLHGRTITATLLGGHVHQKMRRNRLERGENELL